MMRVSAQSLIAMLVMGCGTPSSSNFWDQPPEDQTEAETPQASPSLLAGGHMVGAPDGSALYVANTDVNTVSRLTPSGAALIEVEVGVGPSSLAANDQSVFVALRGENAIAVLDADDLTVQDTITIGAEPVGMVLSADGQRLYAALAVDNQVLELDTTTMNVLRRWDVTDAPRWLTLHPSGDALFIASAFRGTIHRIDLVTAQAVPTPITMPQLTLPPSLFFGSSEKMERIDADLRITGPIAFSSNGDGVAIPVLMLNPGGVGDDEDSPDGGYGQEATIPGQGPMTPVLITADLDGDTRDGDTRDGDTRDGDTRDGDTGNGGMLDTDAIEMIGVQGSAMTSARSFSTYISDVRFTDDGRALLATMEASNVVVSISRETPLDALEVTAVDRYIQLHPMSAMEISGGPRTLVTLPNGDAFTYNFLDRSVAPIDLQALSSMRESHKDFLDAQMDFFSELLIEGDMMNAPEFVWFENPTELDFQSPNLSFLASDKTLGDALETGRRLFFSGADSRMSAGSSVSCGTCHFEGRNDGVTWELENGPRQTPSLSGGIAATAPFTWSNDVERISDEVMLTSQGRMGGNGLTNVEARQVAAYINALIQIAPASQLDTEAVQRGKAAFTKAGCEGCHTGAMYTDNISYAVYDGALLNTPTLVGIGSTGPYFHDGSAATLRDVLQRSKGGGMGNTSVLSADEMEDLTVFLRSL